MSDISKKIIDKIHEDNIKPTPRHYFVVKNVTVWLALLASVIFGAVSVTIEETLVENSSAPYKITPLGVSHFFINSLSFLWIFSTLLFMALAYLNLRSTKEGYRYRSIWIILAIILLFLILGVFLHHEGLQWHVNNFMFTPNSELPYPPQSATTFI